MAVIISFIFLTAPFWYGIFFKKKKFLSFVMILVMASVIMVLSNINQTLISLDDSTTHIFSAESIDADNTDFSQSRINYKDYVTVNNKNLKNILLLASDKRPNNSDASFRTDTIILISIDLNTRNIFVFTLPRDTIVRYTIDKMGENSICKLGEVTAKTGIQGLINTIRLNFGIDINEYMVVTWQSLINFFDCFFEDGIEIDLNEIELLGINQTLPAQNKSFGLEKHNYMFTEFDSNLPFGEEELEYLKKLKKEQELYRINDILKESKTFTRRFDDKNYITYTLNSHQLLAYLRDRHPYKSQDTQRQRNTLSLISKILPTIISKINDHETLEKFDKLCEEKGSIPSTYTDLKSLINDLLIPVKAINIGKNIAGDRVTQIPYLTNNYTGTLDYTYRDLRYQTETILYDKEDEFYE